MRPSTLIFLTTLLVSLVSAGLGSAAVGAAGCLAACSTAFAVCHAAGHSLAIFTFTVSSWIAGMSCHHVFIACEAECTKTVVLPAALAPVP